MNIIDESTVLILGDKADDYLLLPAKNNTATSEEAHLFLEWPDDSSIVHTTMSGATEILYAILSEGKNKERRMRVLANYLQSTDFKPNDRVDWVTFSKWIVKEMSDADKDAKDEYFAFWEEEDYVNQSDKKIGAFLDRHYGRSSHSCVSKSSAYPFDTGVVSLDVAHQVNGSDVQSEPDNKQYDVIAVYSNCAASITYDGYTNRIREAFNFQLESNDTEHPFVLIRTLIGLGRRLPDFVVNLSPGIKQNTVLLFNIDEFQWGGFSVEKPVSWEQVFRDTAQCIQMVEGYDDYCAIVVCLKNQGAVIHRKGYFSLVFFDGDIGDLSSKSGENLIYGSMLVSQAALTVALARLKAKRKSVAAGGNERALNLDFEELFLGVAAGLFAKRRLFSTGYDVRTNREKNLVRVTKIAFPALRVSHDILRVYDNNDEQSEDRKTIESNQLPAALIVKGDSLSQEKPFESVLKTVVWNNACLSIPVKDVETTRVLCVKPEDSIFELCRQIVERGSINNPDSTKVKNALGEGLPALPCKIPYLRMQNLLTYDSNEISQICDTYNVLKLYRRSPGLRQPLSICVFGPAGSGKSFVVHQIMEVLNESKTASLTEFSDISFNLSQMTDSNQLVDAFHQIRDLGLNEKLPIVFFDEFDSKYGDTDFGWLCFFLAPMQDGEFFHEGKIHTIGRAIFVFGGSIAKDMKEFREKTAGHNIKGSDFVSRIKGYIEVPGPNETKSGILHYFRRATLLRSTLEKVMKLSHGDYISIEENVLFAFLNAERYYHGARSMEAIVKMSEFPPNKRITASCLYKSSRLNLHVSPDFQAMLKLDSDDLSAWQAPPARSGHKCVWRRKRTSIGYLV